MKGHLIIKSVHFQLLCLRPVSFTHSLLVQPVRRNYTSCPFPVCQSSYIPMALLQLTSAFATIQALLPVCQPIYQCVQHNDLSLLLNPAHLIQECTLLNDQYKPFSCLPSDQCVQRISLPVPPYSGLSYDQCIPCTVSPLHPIQVFPVTREHNTVACLYYQALQILFRSTYWPVWTLDCLCF